MFNLQGSEIIIVLLLALVVLGPEKLPDAMRKMGQAYAEFKKMSSGFQSEFRAAVDEPLRELRDTANVLRDSADFTKLRDGEREEKPKSAEMADLAPGDPDLVPTDETPTFDTPTAAAADGPDLAADSKPSPFDEHEQPPPDDDRAPAGPTPIPAPPLPFTGMSSADETAAIDDHDATEMPADGEVSAELSTDEGTSTDDATTDDAATDDASTDDETDTTR